MAITFLCAPQFQIHKSFEAFLMNIEKSVYVKKGTLFPVELKSLINRFFSFGAFIFALCDASYFLQNVVSGKGVVRKAIFCQVRPSYRHQAMYQLLLQMPAAGIALTSVRLIMILVHQ